ncbi:MAG: cation:proton antiporter [Candidatus Zixiibacteriota bacterium]
MLHRRGRSILLLLVVAFLAVALPATAGAGTGHGEDVAPVVLGLAIILAGAKIGGDLAVRLGQPAVLGELVVGVLLGNLDVVGVNGFEFMKEQPAIGVLAQLGVIILLFEVGLESTVREMFQVGVPSLLVAVLGVVTPFLLGWGVGAVILPQHSTYAHIFLGAVLTATSVGITARVLSDLGQSRSPEARVILGAAVLDDVLGLVILALVINLINAAALGQTLSFAAISAVLGKAIAFLFGALALGVFVSPRLFGVASRLRGQGVLLVTALVFCFILSYLAWLIGLAPIVGAYAAGLILEETHFREFTARGEQKLNTLVHPISTFLVPVFFVLMGIQVEVRAFANPGVLGLAALLTLGAILGKQACSLGAIRRGLDKLTIGIGMIPRGEVGLIFASIGLGLTLHGERIIDEGVYSAVVIMVIVTTMVTPPALTWSLRRHARLQRRQEAVRR